jgi:hypothetical protein
MKASQKCEAFFDKYLLGKYKKLKFVLQNFIVMKNLLLDNDREPTDEELSKLMHEVTIEVKEKAAKAKIEFAKKINLQVAEAKERFKLKYA